MTKYDLNSKVTVTSLLGMKCGDCLHFKKLPKNGTLCCQEGIREFASAPSSCYQPDYTQVSTDIEQFACLSSMMQGLSNRQAKIVVSILLNAHKSKNKKFPFGTKVYIRTGQDYINNYLSAFVMGYTNNGQVVISGSPEHFSKGKSFIGFVDISSCMDITEWKKKKAKLQSLGKVNDPSSYTQIKTSIDQYEPEIPTIDNVPEEWSSEKPKKKKLDTYDQITKAFTRE